MDKEIDLLMKSDLLKVPDDFTSNVMANLEPLPVPESISQRWKTLKWVAYAGGGCWGLSQLLTYMFGIWAVTSASY